MTIEVVNAFVDGPDLVILSREGTRVSERRVRPEYSFFVRRRDLDAAGADFSRMLRQSRPLVAMKEEGPWTRLCWSDEYVRRAMTSGKRDGDRKVQSPFQERGIDTFEGDVDPVRRWFTDTPDAAIAKPRRGYYDLETDSRVSPREAKLGRARVLSWAVCGEDPESVRSGMLREWSDSAERDLLYAYFEAVADLDQLLAWSGDDFDEPVLDGRTANLGVSYDMRRKLWLDHLKLYKRMNLNSSESGAEKQSMKLGSIAQATIGEGKEELPPEMAKKWPGRTMGSLSYELYDAGGEWRSMLDSYNRQDTKLLPKIEKVTGFAALFDTLCDVCRVLPNSRGLLPTQQMDGFMLRLGAERAEAYRFPTRIWKDRDEAKEDEDPFAGAFVMEPKAKGITRDVHVADFASLYPSIIQTWNMSPETKRGIPVNGPIPEGHCRSPMTGIGFTTAFDGILPIALREMIRLRKAWSEKQASLTPGTTESKEAARRSMAYKVAANSFYGVVGSPYSRYFDRSIAESVTQNGVWLIRQTIAAAEEKGMEVVYGDTDSFFAKGATQTEMEEFVAWCNKDLYPRLLRSVGCRLEHCAIKLAYEKAFDRIVMVTAKRYAGTFLHYKGTRAKPMPGEGEKFDKERHSRPEIKGLEYKRGDAAVLARTLQEKVIMDILRGIDRPEAYRAYLETTLAHVSKDELPLEEVMLAKSLSKKTSAYHHKTSTGKDGAVPPHVRVAEMLEAAGKPIGEGSRVAYVVVDGSDGIKAIPAEDYKGECDRFYLWENLVYPPTQRLLQAAFPDQNWVEGLERIRPKKPRITKSNDPEGQVLLFGLPIRQVLEIEEAVVGSTGELLHPIAEEAKRRQGEQAVELQIDLKLASGATAVLVAAAASSLDGVARAKTLYRFLKRRSEEEAETRLHWENQWRGRG